MHAACSSKKWIVKTRPVILNSERCEEYSNTSFQYNGEIVYMATFQANSRVNIFCLILCSIVQKFRSQLGQSYTNTLTPCSSASVNVCIVKKKIEIEFIKKKATEISILQFFNWNLAVLLKGYHKFPECVPG